MIRLLNKYVTDSNGNYVTGDGGFTTAKGHGAGSHHGGLVLDNDSSGAGTVVVVLLVVAAMICIMAALIHNFKNGHDDRWKDNGTQRCIKCGRFNFYIKMDGSQGTMNFIDDKCPVCRVEEKNGTNQTTN